MNVLSNLNSSSNVSTTSGGFFDIEAKKAQLKQVEEEMNLPGFWEDHAHAAQQSKRASQINIEVSQFQKLLDSITDLLEIAHEDQRDQSVNLLVDIQTGLDRAHSELQQLEFSVLFSNPLDCRNAIVTIYAGSGGTDAMDWAQMLQRMIERFCQRRGFRWRVLEQHDGEVAGLKSLTAEVHGSYAYGWLKSESGVHRLVRISPFDAEQMRHTSFAMIEVLPEFDELDEIIIHPDDLRIDTYLSSGHGGQSVQTTYSAVRVVHIPTGITVSCQNERSQLQNKENALKILKAKLVKKQQEDQARSRQELRGEILSADWGNQIRSYVLHPYKLVKDHRSGYESADPTAVLGGELESFVEKYLQWLKQPSTQSSTE